MSSERDDSSTAAPGDALLRDLLPEVQRLVAEAGARIMEIYASDFAVDTKADDSPLTQADLASHTVLTEGLGKLADFWPVLSEESAAMPWEERREWSVYWLIDPLDGTREFVKRNDEFTVNVALVVDGQPVLGVVASPALDLCYYAARGAGAWRRKAGQQPQAIRVAEALRQPAKVAGSRSHAGDSLRSFLSALGEHELVSMGSSLKICLVADGTVDVYPRLGPTSEWDTAAAQCVVEQAGGSMCDLELRPMRYNQGDSLLNPHFIAFGDSSPDWRALIAG